MQCGLTDGVSGFRHQQQGASGKAWTWDICRAVAAAVFGDPTKFKGTALSTQQRFTALQSGKSMLLRTVTLTQTRDTRWACRPWRSASMTARASW